MGVFQSTRLTEFDRENMPVSDGGKVEGYWAEDKEESTIFPFPVGSDNPWPGKAEFLTKLREKEGKAENTQFRGTSRCRLVKKNNCEPDIDDDMMVIKNNGSSEFSMSTPAGDQIAWPEGYAHYIEVHNVKPSREFYNFIMNWSW